MKLNRLFLAAMLVGSALVVQSCAVAYYPPRAPGHGYAVVRGEVELVFDSGLGLYVVTGHPNYYYYGGYYYHVYDGGYERSRTLDAGYAAIDASRLPPGLAKKYGPPQGHEHGHGRWKRHY